MQNVGVGLLLWNDFDEVLLLLRREGPDAGMWSIPGGALEPFETPYEAAIRETAEEVGIICEPTRYLGAFRYAAPFEKFEGLSLSFEGRTTEPAFNLEPLKHAMLKWWNPASLPKNIAPPATFAISKACGAKSAVVSHKMYSSPDVLLIQPFFPLADMESLSIPLGLASIHTSLKKSGFTVDTIDCSLPTEYLRFCIQLSKIKPKIVGVQFHSDMSYEWANLCCRFVRRHSPNSLIVAGGEVASKKAVELLQSLSVDVVVRDEGEETMLELVAEYLRGNSYKDVVGLSFWNAESAQVLHNTQRPFSLNLDALPMIDLDDFKWSEYGQWTLFTSRGCPFRCTYCSSAAFWRHSIRYHSARRVVDELRRLYEGHGARDVYIADDTFTLDRNRIVAVCDGIQNARIPIRWSCLTRVDCIDPELLMIMRESGCILISFGVESGNESTLQVVRKHASVIENERAIEMCREFGIRTRISLIFGLPGEGPTHLLRTLKLLLRARPNEIQLYGLTPHDGTSLYDNLTSLGVRILEPNPMLWSRNVLRPVCETDELPRDVIISLANQFVSELVLAGYTYLDETLDSRKLGAEFTVATSFSPVQVIGSVRG